MAEASWTKTGEVNAPDRSRTKKLRFIVVGALLLAAIVYLVVNAMRGSTQLYKTVDEFFADQARLTGRDLRVAGWVVGDSIQYTQIDAATSTLEFDIVEDMDNPGQALHIVAHNEPMPDLLQNRAQALVEGQADATGTFTANPGGLFLKCPTRYEELEPSV